mmetsp:Transcript_43146/g.73361  ORF Transcript_43146/g.73361 Transcript_43146/m.73361 type:complete len:413 (+) Transcript_43146:320-1558(+)
MEQQHGSEFRFFGIVLAWCRCCSSSQSSTKHPLLVRDAVAVGVADLALEVRPVLGLVLADAVPERPLRVRVDVHLDDTRLDGVPNVLHARAAAAVEHELHRLGALRQAELLRDVFLRVVKDLWLEAHVARSVDAVHVAESGRNGEVGVGHGAEGLVHLPHLGRLRVELGAVHVAVVHAVLLPARDAQLHLQHQIDLGHALHVALADGDVVLERLLREVQHVGRKQGLAVRSKVLLVGRDEAIEPRQPRLAAVVRVEDHGHAVKLGHLANVQSTRDCAGNGGRVVRVVGGLARNEGAAAAGEGDHDGAAGEFGRLHARVDRVGADDVHAGHGKSLVFGVVEEVAEGRARHHARLDGGRQGHVRRRGGLQRSDAGRASTVDAAEETSIGDEGRHGGRHKGKDDGREFHYEERWG